MSLQTREFHVHIEMLRHVQQDDGQCAVGCGEWSMSHVALAASRAVSACIAAELEEAAKVHDEKGENSLAAGLRAAALKVREGST